MSAQSVDTSTKGALTTNQTTTSVRCAASPKALLSPSKPRLPGKYSRQREMIYQTVLESGEHPTAEAVYQTVRRKCPDISLGTVYRNLGRLSECGAIQKIGVPGGSDHFDGTLREHYHLFCTGCGRVYDVDLPELDDLRQSVQEKTGFEVSGYNLTFRGLCRECKIKNEEENV